MFPIRRDFFVCKFHESFNGPIDKQVTTDSSGSEVCLLGFLYDNSDYRHRLFFSDVPSNQYVGLLLKLYIAREWISVDLTISEAGTYNHKMINHLVELGPLPGILLITVQLDILRYEKKNM